MSSEAAPVDRQRQKIAEFMQMLPLTMAIAGLPPAEHGKYFSEGQLEARATAIRTAYKHARGVLMEIAK